MNLTNLNTIKENININPLHDPVLYRTYTRFKDDGTRENWEDLVNRVYSGLCDLGKLSPQLEKNLLISCGFSEESLENYKHLTRDGSYIKYFIYNKYCLPSGRNLWVLGTDWARKQDNYYGLYNCCGRDVYDFNDIAILFDLLCQGTGTGANVSFIFKEHPNTPFIRTEIFPYFTGEFSDYPGDPNTIITVNNNYVRISIGDSRTGWVHAYRFYMWLSAKDFSKYGDKVYVEIDISNVRKAGLKISGFGGKSNPSRLKDLFKNAAKYLSKILNKKLDSVTASLLINEAGLAVVAGNVRRCLSEDTMVSTNSGEVPIKNIKKGDLVHSFLYTNKVSDVFYQGIQPVFEIRPLNSEYPSLISTANHKHAVLSYTGMGYEWKTTEELTLEDRLIRRIVTKEGFVYNMAVPIASIEPAGDAVTYDIEVEEEHNFYANGYLTHNSANIQISDAEDIPFSKAKDNLWKQVVIENEDGSTTTQWVIDPDRDAMRMANLSRVFYTKPNKSQVEEAVIKQYYSGEGAILYANESIARSNADIITPEIKKDFIKALDEGKGKEFLKKLNPDMSEREIYHRLNRYSTNPCLTAENLVLTSEGVFHISEIVDKTVTVWTGSCWVDTVFTKSNNTYNYLVQLVLNNGSIITATDNHIFLVSRSDKNIIYRSAADLSVGDELASVDLYSVSSSFNTYDVNISDDSLYGMGYNLMHYYKAIFLNKHKLSHYVAGIIDKLSVSDNVVLAKKVLIQPPPVDSYITLEMLQTFLLCLDIPSFIRFNRVSKSYHLVIYQDDISLLSSLPLRRVKGKTSKVVKESKKLYVIKQINIIEDNSRDVYCCNVTDYNLFTLANGVLTHNCGEVIGKDFMCSLSDVHLIKFYNNPQDFEKIKMAFILSAFMNASHLHQDFPEHRFSYSRNLDPITQVTFTGAVDYFVSLFGMRWLEWWHSGRQDSWGNAVSSLEYLNSYSHQFLGLEPFSGLESDVFNRLEQTLLSRFREWASMGIITYTKYFNLKTPNRFTGHQPAGCTDVFQPRVLDQGIYTFQELVSIYGSYSSSSTSDGNKKALSARGIPIIEVVSNKPTDLYKITFKNNRSIFVTPNHKFIVEDLNNSWVNTSDLKKGFNLKNQYGTYTNQDKELYPDYVFYLLGIMSASCVISNSCLSVSLLSQVLTNNSVSIDSFLLSSKLKEASRKFGEPIKYSYREYYSINKIKVVSDIYSFNKEDTDYLMNYLKKYIDKNDLYDLIYKSLSIPLFCRSGNLTSIFAFIAGIIDSCGMYYFDGDTQFIYINFYDSGLKDNKVTPFKDYTYIKPIYVTLLESLGIPVFIDTVYPSIYLNISYLKESFPDRYEILKKYSMKILNSHYYSDQLASLHNYDFFDYGRNCSDSSTLANWDKFTISDVNKYYSIDKIEYYPKHLVEKSKLIFSDTSKSSSTDVVTYDISLAVSDDLSDAWYYLGALLSHNTKSLLTNSSPGIHMPKSAYYIRRITFSANDPVALACRDYGYNITPGQSDTDENGNLLSDPYDPRVKEWLVEIPMKAVWADDLEFYNKANDLDIDVSKFSFAAQWDFYMQNQIYYTTFNTSATLEFTKDEIPEVTRLIFDAISNDRGYISAALLARFEDFQTFPRMPFEPISRERYIKEVDLVYKRRKEISNNKKFKEILDSYDLISTNKVEGLGGISCDSDKCLL